MQNYARKAAVSLLAGGVLAVGALTPASAQPIITGGLVNVVIDDVTVVVRNVSVGAALGIAANLCDVNVNVLATQLRTGEPTCTIEDTGQTVEITQN